MCVRVYVILYLCVILNKVLVSVVILGNSERKTCSKESSVTEF